MRPENVRYCSARARAAVMFTMLGHAGPDFVGVVSHDTRFMDRIGL